MIVGNDISQYQGDIKWDIYKNNANFVIIRSSYGNGYFDKWFARNRDEARRVGLPVGFYHFCYPQYNTAEAEAAWFCKAVYDLRPGEVLALDFEADLDKNKPYTENPVPWCKAFLDYVSAHFNGIKPLIYLNQSHMKWDWSPVVNAGYGLWLASYNPDGQGNTGKWPFMAMQQTSSSQKVPGITDNVVDRDVFFGDSAGFRKYGYVAPQPSPAPTPSPSTPEPTVPTTPPSPTPDTYDAEVVVTKEGFSVNGTVGEMRVKCGITIKKNAGIVGKKDIEVVLKSEIPELSDANGKLDKIREIVS